MHVDLAVLSTPDELRALATPLEPWIAERLGPESGATTTQVLASIERRLVEPETLVLVARSEAQPARGSGAHSDLLGVLIALAHVDPFSGQRRPEICMLHVHASWRNRGLARALVADATRRLHAAGARAVMARAPHNDDARISMGERWGFVRTDELMERS
jgi:ribosomal protein S18 acetylase RimI-like enzyme